MESSKSNATESTHNSSDSDSGCGCKNSTSIKISVTPTTGGQFELAVTKNDTIENLKKLISKKLKVPKERICLLHRERQLRDGTVQENQLVDGSRLTLIPSVETGLLAQRPEQSVMQALESLNDSQVNDFLSGKAPLNLTMRLGDHMMLIQLQLSTVTPTTNSNSVKRSSISKTVPSVPSTKPLISNPLASLTSIVNNSIEETCSKDKRTEILSLLDDTVGSGVESDVKSVGVNTNPCKCDSPRNIGKPTLDTRALAEASRNLTQTLKQLSSEVLTSKADTLEETASHKRRQGAIIESMHHHGKGVYSGTFSGTLNPALQDRFGRPKRDISTIIHILNDLLCATPQYRSARGGLSNTSSTPDKVLPIKIGTSTQIKDPEASCSTHTSPLTTDSLENQATRGKMERLRLIMEERRERRRIARSRPYARTLSTNANIRNQTQWSAKSETQRADSNLPMDTAELCTQPEVTPEPVIA
uniref:Ubiquitin-like domain-containing protein n=1 Tax=Clastoptera arizonana TaxID=38151 RepID=A0A1B6DQN3_9HEMI